MYKQAEVQGYVTIFKQITGPNLRRKLVNKVCKFPHYKYHTILTVILLS